MASKCLTYKLGNLKFRKKNYRREYVTKKKNSLRFTEMLVIKKLC